jgi:hypothetical protein
VAYTVVFVAKLLVTIHLRLRGNTVEFGAGTVLFEKIQTV